jgi:hypothetical protein
MSSGGIVLNAFPLASTNVVSGISAAVPGGTSPSSSVAMLVPKPPWT